MKMKLTFSLAFCLIASIVFSQSQTTSERLRINHSENGAVRGNNKSQRSKVTIDTDISDTFEADAIFASRKPEEELVGKRDRTSKHFKNPDGSIEAFLSTGSINYQENGRWHTIELTITPNNTGKFAEFEFANTKNAFKSFYGQSPENGIKTIVENEEITEWQNKKIEFYDADMNLISSIQSENSEIRINHVKASYPNLFPYTEAQITQLHDGRKIDYEISSAEFVNLIPENAVYIAISEDISLPAGWTAKYYIDEQNENQKESQQRISILTNRKEEILQYQPPVYFEKDNQRGKDDPIGEYMIAQNGQLLTIKTLVDVNWIKDEERNFPIVIDPTVSMYPNNTANWTGAVENDGYDLSDQHIYIGKDGSYWMASWSRFNMSSIDDDAIVSSVSISTVRGADNNYNYLTCQMTSVTLDPLFNSGTQGLYNNINNGTVLLTTSQYETGTSTYNNNLTSIGNNDLMSALSSGRDWYSVGFRTSLAADNNYVICYGHSSGTNSPKLTITYTTPSNPPTCTTPIMPADGFGSHSPADPLTWNTVAGATSYDVYFGTSSNPPLVTNVTTTTYSPSLADNTTYYWKVVPKNAYGEPTGCAVWEFTTGTGPQSGDYRSRYMDGANRMWSIASNWQIYNGSAWVTASIPPDGSTINVLIRDNSKMIIDGDYETNELRIEGLLQFYWGDGATNNTAKTFTVNGDILLTGDADFQTNAAYDANRNFVHLLIAKKNIYNNANSDHGMLLNDYPEISYWSYVQVRFKGSGNAEWSGTGENDIGGLSILKDNPTDVVIIKPNQLLGWGSTNLDGNGFFMYDVIDHVGILKIGGTFSMTTRFGIQSTNTSADDTRQFPQLSSVNSGSDFTLHIDNPNFGISGYSAVECYGNLQITQGTMNVGDNMADYIEFGDGASLTIDGGDLSCTGAIAYLGTGTFNLNLSDGRIRAGYLGNSNSNIVGWFDIRNNANVTISGGEIHLINVEYTTSLDFPMYNMAASNVTITGGVLQIGSDVSPVGTNTYSIAGPAPSIELYSNGSTIASNAILWDNVQCYGNLIIPEYCGLSIYDQDHSDTPYTFSITGNINHEGDLYAEVENSKILFNGSSLQTFHTTGAYSDVSGEAGISILEVDNSAGVQLTGLSTAVTKNMIKTNGTFHIGDCSLGLSGIVTRTNGFLGGNSNSELYITGDGTLGNLFFDPNSDQLNLLELDRQNTGIINLATDLNIAGSIHFINGTLYTYQDNDINNESDTIYLASDAELIDESNNSYLYGAVSISNSTFPQTELSGPETFDTDILVHGASAATTVWFAPDSNDPIAHETSGGCTGGRIGYTGSWNNYWGNFVRLPETDCSTYDQLSLTFDVSHSYFASQTDDWMRFYMWADGGYEHNLVSVKIDGVDVTYDSGMNGKGFQYTESRDCASVEVIFDISAITDKTNILLYLEASCNSNNGNEFYTYFDNISVSGIQTGTVSPDFGNVWAIMNNLNEDLGDITVTRITGADGQMSIADVTSIDCHWDIQTENPPTSPVSMDFKWLDLFDNGLSTSGMIVYTLHEPNPWETVGTETTVSGNPRSISADASHFSKWTVAVKNTVLPVELLYFETYCKAQTKTFQWATASEHNADYFEILESENGKEYTSIFKTTAAGYSSTQTDYSFEITNAKQNAYYRLLQVDFDGTESIIAETYNSCEESLPEQSFSVYPNPFDGQNINILALRQEENVIINLLDSSGRLIQQFETHLFEGNNSIQLPDCMDVGMYIMNIQSNTHNLNQNIQIIVQ